MEEAIRRRLLSDGEGSGDDRRLLQAAKLCLALLQTPSPGGDDERRRQLRAVLGQARCSMRKMLLAQAVSQKKPLLRLGI